MDGDHEGTQLFGDVAFESRVGIDAYEAFGGHGGCFVGSWIGYTRIVRG